MPASNKQGKPKAPLWCRKNLQKPSHTLNIVIQNFMSLRHYGPFSVDLLTSASMPVHLVLAKPYSFNVDVERSINSSTNQSIKQSNAK